MAGNREGGQKAVNTMKERYGEDHMANIGRKGGKSVKREHRHWYKNPEAARKAGKITK